MISSLNGTARFADRSSLFSGIMELPFYLPAAGDWCYGASLSFPAVGVLLFFSPFSCSISLLEQAPSSISTYFLLDPLCEFRLGSFPGLADVHLFHSIGLVSL